MKAVVFVLGVLSLLGVAYLATQSSSSKDVEARVKKLVEINEQEIKEKDKEIKEKDDDIKKLKEQVQSSSQDKAKSEEEKNKIRAALEKALKIAKSQSDKMKKEKQELRKINKSILAQSKEEAKKKIDAFEKRAKKLLTESKELREQINTMRKKGEVEHCVVVDEKGVCTKKEVFKLPEQLKELLEASKKSAEAQLETAKKRYEKLKADHEKDPQNKELGEAVKAAAKDVQEKKANLEEILALAGAAGLLGGPVAAAIAAILAILSGGFEQGRSGSGQNYGPGAASANEKASPQNPSVKKGQATKTKIAKKSSKVIPPAGGTTVVSKSAVQNVLRIRKNMLFRGPAEIGKASSDVQKAVGEGIRILRVVGEKFLIKIEQGKHCKEIYKKNQVWEIGAEQYCPK